MIHYLWLPTETCNTSNNLSRHHADFTYLHVHDVASLSLQIMMHSMMQNEMGKFGHHLLHPGRVWSPPGASHLQFTARQTDVTCRWEVPSGCAHVKLWGVGFSPFSKILGGCFSPLATLILPPMFSHLPCFCLLPSILPVPSVVT